MGSKKLHKSKVVHLGAWIALFGATNFLVKGAMFIQDPRILSALLAGSGVAMICCRCFTHQPIE